MTGNLALRAAQIVRPVPGATLGLKDAQRPSSGPDGLFPEPDDVHTGACIMLMPTVDDQQMLSEFAVIATDDIHCTTMWLGKAKVLEDRGVSHSMLADVVRRVAAATPLIEAELGGITRFVTPGGHKDPIVLNVDSKPVGEFRIAIEKALEAIDVHDDSEHGYNPHVTLGYVLAGRPNPITTWKPVDIIFDRVRVSFGEDAVDIRLGVWDDNMDVKAVMVVCPQCKQKYFADGSADIEKHKKNCPRKVKKTGENRLGQVAAVARVAGALQKPRQDREKKDLRRVRDAEYWGLPVGTPISDHITETMMSTDELDKIKMVDKILDEDHVAKKRKDFEDGEEPEPVMVEDSPQGLYMSDGHHRLEAAKQAGYNRIRVLKFAATEEGRRAALRELNRRERAKSEVKDVTAHSGGHSIGIGLGTTLQTYLKPLPRPKRGRLKKIKHHMVPNTPLAWRTKSLLEAKSVRHVKDSDYWNLPVGTIIVGNPKGDGEPLANLQSVDTDYDGAEAVKGSNGQTYIIAQDDDDSMWVAMQADANGEISADAWDDPVVKEKGKEYVYRRLDEHVGGGKKVPRARLKPPAKEEKPTKPLRQRAGTAKKAAAAKKTTTRKAAAKQGQPSVAKLLSTSGGDKTLADKDGREHVGTLETTPPKNAGKVKAVTKRMQTKRDNPADYHMRNGKPVQSAELRERAHLAAGGSQAAIDKAHKEGRELRLAPARDNEHLWFPKDPKSPVAYSFRQAKPKLDKDGNPVYRDNPKTGKKEMVFTGEFGPRQTVYTKEFMDANREAKDAKIAELAANMHKLDSALKRDITKPDAHDAHSVLLMRLLGMRPNTMSEEQQEKNLSKKSPLKARSLRARGIDPDQPIYGATSLQARHVKVDGNKATIEFVGKEHVLNTHVTDDPDIVRMLKARLAKTKKDNDPLFPGVTADSTKAYIQKHLGPGITNKDLRAYCATQIALRLMATRPAPKTQEELDRAKAEIAVEVCYTLNNAARQSLGSYIAAPIWKKWEEGVK